MPCIISPCPCCKNFIMSKEHPSRCAAFPEEIPDEYFKGKIKVRELEECSNGFKFEDKYGQG